MDDGLLTASVVFIAQIISIGFRIIALEVYILVENRRREEYDCFNHPHDHEDESEHDLVEVETTY